MHLLLRCQMTSRHHWTLSSVGFWNVQDRRVNFYTRMSKFQAAVLNVCAPAQFQALLSDTRGGFCAVGQLAVCKEVLKRSLLLHAPCAGRVAAASHALSKDQAQA